MHKILGCFIVALTALSVAGTSVVKAQGQQACGKRVDIVKLLAAKYNETRTARGVAQGANSLVELFTTPTGSWTLVVTGLTGVSCLVSAGENWEAVPAKFVAKVDTGGA